MTVVNDRTIIVYRQWSERADCWFRWRYGADGTAIAVSEAEESEWIEHGHATAITVKGCST